jgi:hypothetical protein
MLNDRMISRPRPLAGDTVAAEGQRNMGCFVSCRIGESVR